MADTIDSSMKLAKQDVDYYVGSDSKTKKKREGIISRSEPLWIICTEGNPIKRELDDGVNKVSKRMDNLADLVNFNTLVKHEDGSVSATLVFTNDVPPLIKSALPDIVEYIRRLKHVRVYEVGFASPHPKVFKSSTKGIFGSMAEFVRYAQTAMQDAEIDDLDPADRKAQLLLSLRNENESLKQRIHDADLKYQGVQADLLHAQRALTDLQAKIDNTYKPKLSDQEDYIGTLEDSKKALTRQVEADKNIIHKHQEAGYRKDSEIEDLKNKIDGLNGYINDKKLDAMKLRKERDALKEQVDRLVEEKRRIIDTRVDSEVVGQLNEALEAGKKREADLRDKNLQERRHSNKLSIEVDQIKQQMDDLIKSKGDLSKLGRTVIVHGGVFDRTPLIYIKVFDELSFHRHMIDMLYRKFIDVYDFKHPHLIVLKHQDHEDDLRFKKYLTVATLNDVDSMSEYIRLVPNSEMAEGISKFEGWSDFIVVVDYLKDDKYYFDTKAKKSVITLVQASSELRDFKLQGLPISYDSDSIYNIHYSKDIATALSPKIKEGLLMQRVNALYKTLSSYY